MLDCVAIIVHRTMTMTLKMMKRRKSNQNQRLRCALLCSLSLFYSKYFRCAMLIQYVRIYTRNQRTQLLSSIAQMALMCSLPNIPILRFDWLSNTRFLTFRSRTNTPRAITSLWTGTLGAL